MIHIIRESVLQCMGRNMCDNECGRWGGVNVKYVCGRIRNAKLFCPGDVRLL